MKRQYRKTIDSLRGMLSAARADKMDSVSNVWRSLMISADDEIQNAGIIDDLKDQDIKRQYRSATGVLGEMLGAAEVDGKDIDESGKWHSIMEVAQQALDLYVSVRQHQFELERPRA
jgi:hypothetical protein